MSLTDQAAQVLAEIDAELAICEKDGELLPELAVDFEAAHSFEDSYDVPGSEWMCCDICKAEDKPGIFSNGIPHDETCKVFRANRIIAASRTVCPKSLRMNKTAIEGLLSVADYRVEFGHLQDKAAIALKDLINQWNENK